MRLVKTDGSRVPSRIGIASFGAQELLVSRIHISLGSCDSRCSCVTPRDGRWLIPMVALTIQAPERKQFGQLMFALLDQGAQQARAKHAVGDAVTAIGHGKVHAWPVLQVGSEER